MPLTCTGEWLGEFNARFFEKDGPASSGDEGRFRELSITPVWLALSCSGGGISQHRACVTCDSL